MKTRLLTERTNTSENIVSRRQMSSLSFSWQRLIVFFEPVLFVGELFYKAAYLSASFQPYISLLLSDYQTQLPLLCCRFIIQSDVIVTDRHSATFLLRQCCFQSTHKWPTFVTPIEEIRRFKGCYFCKSTCKNLCSSFLLVAIFDDILVLNPWLAHLFVYLGETDAIH